LIRLWPLLLCLSGCGRVRDCAPGTLLVNVYLGAEALSHASITLGVDVTIDGVRRENRFEVEPTLEIIPVEITFPSGYPTGKRAGVRVTAANGALLLGEADGTITLDPACGVLPLAMHAPNPDAAMQDLLPAID
jgi:hypothetical protein